jgi:hypothetical protein
MSVNMDPLIKRLGEALLRNAQYIDRAKNTPGGYLDTLKYDRETLMQAMGVVVAAGFRFTSVPGGAGAKVE